MRHFLISLFLFGCTWPVAAHPELDEQIAAVSRGLERDPQNAALWLRRGELYRIHQDWRRALADYDRAAQCDPRLPGVELARGQMLLEAGRLDRAREVLDRLVATNPQLAPARLVRARLFEAQSLPAKAAAEYGQAIALSTAPEPDWYLQRARLTPEPAVALAGLEEGVKRLGPLAVLMVPALELELQQKHYDAALARVDLLMAQAPRKETWLARRGEILEQAGRPTAARDAYAAALAALETLPAARRQTIAMAELGKKLQEKLHAQH